MAVTVYEVKAPDPTAGPVYDSTVEANEQTDLFAQFNWEASPINIGNFTKTTETKGLFRFEKKSGDTLPKNAIITDAYLEVTASGDSGIGSVDYVFNMLGNDGRWNKEGSGNTPTWVNHTPHEPEFISALNFIGEIYDSGGIIGQSWSGQNGQQGYVPMQSSTTGVSPFGLSQAIEATSSGTLDKVSVRLNKSSVLITSANLHIKVYPAEDADGGVFVPVTGTLLAESDPVLTTSLGISAQGQMIDFNFSGADQIFVPSGSKYMYTMNDSYGPDAYSHNWFYRRHVSFAQEGIGHSSLGFDRGFTQNNYHRNIDLSDSFQSLPGYPITPSGNTLRIELPDFTSGTVYQIGSLASIVQTVVGGEFVDDQDLGLLMAVTSVAAADDSRTITASDSPTPAQLVITHRDPQRTNLTG